MALKLVFNAVGTPIDSNYQNVIKDRSPKELKTIFKGKSVLVTGATKGIGSGIAKEFAKHGANVEILGRSEKEGAAVLAEMKQLNPEGKFVFHKVDCGKAQDCYDFATSFIKSHESLDYLINCVAVIAGSKRKTNDDGLEVDFAIGYFSRYVLLSVLGPWMNSKGKRSTVCNICGSGTTLGKIVWDDIQSEKTYDSLSAHNVSIAFNDLMIFKASQLYTNIDFLGFHPGFVKTGNIPDATGPVLTAILGFLMGAKGPEHYAEKVFIQEVATAEMEMKGAGIRMFDPFGNVRLPAEITTNPENLEKMREYCESLIQKLVKK